jgi:hypothetical protein
LNLIHDEAFVKFAFNAKLRRYTKEYGESWCHFGCAARELDPAGKFASSSDVFTWGGIDLEGCCGYGRANTVFHVILDVDIFIY